MSLFDDVWRLLMPAYCVVCGRKLAGSERHVCVACLALLPRLIHPAAPSPAAQGTPAPSPAAQDALAPSPAAKDTPAPCMHNGSQAEEAPSAQETPSAQASSAVEAPARHPAASGSALGTVLGERFVECASLRGAVGWLAYERGNAYDRLIRLTKYDDLPAMGRYLGRCAAQELRRDARTRGFFDDIDMIVPIPLARQRLRQRGYNQSDYIARGLGDVTGLPVATDIVVRTAHKGTQTRLGREERRRNVEGVFVVRHAERLHDKHVLLVDDVVTTGATMASCIHALEEAVPGIRTSVFALAQARTNR